MHLPRQRVGIRRAIQREAGSDRRTDASVRRAAVVRPWADAVHAGRTGLIGHCPLLGSKRQRSCVDQAELGNTSRPRSLGDIAKMERQRSDLQGKGHRSKLRRVPVLASAQAALPTLSWDSLAPAFAHLTSAKTRASGRSTGGSEPTANSRAEDRTGMSRRRKGVHSWLFRFPWLPLHRPSRSACPDGITVASVSPGSNLGSQRHAAYGLACAWAGAGANDSNALCQRGAGELLVLVTVGGDLDLRRQRAFRRISADKRCSELRPTNRDLSGFEPPKSPAPCFPTGRAPCAESRGLLAAR